MCQATLKVHVFKDLLMDSGTEYNSFMSFINTFSIDYIYLKT